ncbi:unnamed protein product [Blepharisma stoltei]|uniref:Letm1 RBD domain-containing protein n=1 Tax=Blepharisma stoltei TaxID=1481888 RepID=A0AAU9I5G8_9CILI|nr:unnamed protein product [Blepharisma stoltei]
MNKVQTIILKSNFRFKRNFSENWWNPRKWAGYIKHESKKVWQGCKLLYHDGKYMIKTKYRLTFYEDTWTIHDSRIISRVTPDLLKMIPFSFFIIIPGAELTLPFFLFIFPNMIPSPFLSKTKEDEHWKNIIAKRKVYANKLHRYLIEKSKEIKDLKYKTFKEKLIYRPNSMKIEDLVMNHQLFLKDFNFGNMNAEELKSVCRFLGMEPWTGFKSISKLVLFPLSKLFSYIGLEIPSTWNPTTFPFNQIQRNIVMYQLRNYLSQKRGEDMLLLAEDIDFIEYPLLIACCQERGIDTEFLSDTDMRNCLKEWIYYSAYPLTKGPVKSEILVFSVALKYLEDGYDIGEFFEEEKPEEIEDSINAAYQETMERILHYDKRKILELLELAENTSVEQMSESQRNHIREKLTEVVEENLFYDEQDRIKRVLKKIENALNRPGEIIEGPEKSENNKKPLN